MSSSATRELSDHALQDATRPTELERKCNSVLCGVWLAVFIAALATSLYFLELQPEIRYRSNAVALIAVAGLLVTPRIVYWRRFGPNRELRRRTGQARRGYYIRRAKQRLDALSGRAVVGFSRIFTPAFGSRFWWLEITDDDTGRLEVSVAPGTLIRGGGVEQRWLRWRLELRREEGQRLQALVAAAMTNPAHVPLTDRTMRLETAFLWMREDGGNTRHLRVTNAQFDPEQPLGQLTLEVERLRETVEPLS